MGLRDKLKKSVKRHKVELSIGTAYVVAFHGDKRSMFMELMAKIRDAEKVDSKRDESINALTVAISLVDEKGDFPYKPEEYPSVISEMLSADIEEIVMLSADVNGLSIESKNKHKKKSKKAKK